jgi:hypothetical protein
MAIEVYPITRLAQELGMVPIELRRELRPQLRASAAHIVEDMKTRSSYSSRIPSAIRMTVSFSRTRGGITIRVDAKKAPEARVLERGNLGGRAAQFRHPVFGDMDTWVTQDTRPFFFPAVRAGRPELSKRISEAVRASLPKGFS